MMLDASIYDRVGRIKSVQDWQNEAAQAQANQLAVKLNTAKYDEYNRGVQTQNALRSAVLTGDDQADFNTLRAIDPAAAYAHQKATVEAKEKKAKTAHEEAQADKERLASGLKRFEIVGQIMGGVKDQATYDAARQQAASVFGQEFAAQMNPVYDSQAIAQSQQRAMSVKERLEQEWKQKGYDRDIANDAERVRQFGVTSTETARSHRANEGIQVRGQNMLDARARDGQAAEMTKPFELTDRATGEPVLVRQDKAGNITPVTEYAPKGGNTGKPLPQTVVKSLTEARDNATTITRLKDSFKDDYGSKGVYGVGADASMNAKGVLGTDKDAVEWWKNYRKQAELTERHALFGAALTPGEQASWRSADISPGMDPTVISRNLATRATLAQKVADNTAQDMIDAGHSADRVSKIAGRNNKTQGLSADEQAELDQLRARFGKK